MSLLNLNLREWYELKARTRQQRLEIAGTILFDLLILIVLLPIIIVLWKLIVALLVLLVIICIILSPLAVWVLRGKK